MSTITKLDPEHRLRRTDRRNSLRALARTVQMFVGAHRVKEAARASLTLDALTTITREPSLHGDVKHAIFNSAMTQVTA
jgi:hypothetical protein